MAERLTEIRPRCIISAAPSATYVGNIFKYYVSCKLTQDAQATAAKLREQVAPVKK